MTAYCDWLRVYDAISGAPEVRLVCFPHAGGTASSYAPWRDRLDDRIELVSVRYPGREDRLAEPMSQCLEAMADAVTEDVVRLQTERPLPLVLLGHSMGASVAHEVAVRLRMRARAVALLIVSARLPVSSLDTGAERLSDEELAVMLGRMDPTTIEVLTHPELRELVWPSIRSDYDITCSYGGHDAPQLDIPILALGGRSDAWVDGASMVAWERATTAGFSSRLFDGDHFFLHDNPEVLALMNDFVCAQADSAPDARSPA